jgi:hypothetical protein
MSSHASEQTYPRMAAFHYSTSEATSGHNPNTIGNNHIEFCTNNRYGVDAIRNANCISFKFAVVLPPRKLRCITKRDVLGRIKSSIPPPLKARRSPSRRPIVFESLRRIPIPTCITNRLRKGKLRPSAFDKSIRCWMSKSAPGVYISPSDPFSIIGYRDLI